MVLVTRSGDRRWRYENAGSDLTTTLTETIESSMQHVAIGVQYFTSGDALVVPTAGEITIEVKSENTMQWEAPPSNVIDCSAPTTVTVAGNINEVRARVTSAISGNSAAKMTLVVTANREG